MIREFRKDEINAVMKIWLESNIDAHPFILSDYWETKYEAVRDAILEAEIYVTANNNQIIGFIGLVQNYIAGLFVDQTARGEGTGSDLIEHIKTRKDRLEIKVYVENLKAVKFYCDHGFEIIDENVDEATGHAEYLMVWKR